MRDTKPHRQEEIERKIPSPRVKGRKGNMSYDAVCNYIHKAVMYGASHIGFDASAQVMEPLAWYINTGRACYEFTARLATKKPYRIFQVLHKAGGSYDDAIGAVKRYLGID